MTRLCGENHDSCGSWWRHEFNWKKGNLAFYAGVGCMVVIVGGVLVPMIKLLPKGNLNIQAGAALYNAIDGNVSKYYHHNNSLNQYPEPTVLYDLLFGTTKMTLIIVFGSIIVLTPLSRLVYQGGLVSIRDCKAQPKDDRGLKGVLGGALCFSLLLFLLGTTLTITGEKQPLTMAIGFSHHTVLSALHMMQAIFMMVYSPNHAVQILSMVGCLLSLAIIAWTLSEAMTGKNVGLDFADILEAGFINIPRNISGTNQSFVTSEEAIAAYIKTLWLQITENSKLWFSLLFQVGGVLEVLGLGVRLKAAVVEKLKEAPCCKRPLSLTGS